MSDRVSEVTHLHKTSPNLVHVKAFPTTIH